MKSAYELAMERLEESEPTQPLTSEQKTEIAAIDEKFRSRIAEREVFLDDLITQAKASGNFGELPELETQKTRELSALRNECEEEKEKVRKG